MIAHPFYLMEEVVSFHTVSGGSNLQGKHENSGCVQAGAGAFKTLLGFGRRQLFWPLYADYFGRSGSGVVGVCRRNCRPGFSSVTPAFPLGVN